MTRKKIAFLLFIITTSFVSAQTLGCIPLQKGKFKMENDEIGTTYITRSKKHQLEETPKIGLKARYDIEWVNECKYILKNRVTLEGSDLFKVPEDAQVIVEIIKVNLKSYNVKVSSNFNNKQFDGLVEIVK